MTNEELKLKAKEYLAENKSGILNALIEEFNVNALQVVHALPYEVCGMANPDSFELIWKEICSWEKAVLHIAHLENYFAFEGKFAQGKQGHGYYNLTYNDGSPIAGHLKIDALACIAFLTLKSHQSEAKYLAFINKEGEITYTIHVPKKDVTMLESISKSFENMKDTYSLNKA